VPDWMALPELGTPINRNILDKAIRAGIAPVRLKALQSLIYNDLAFTFYNRVEAAKIALSSEGATVISLDDKEQELWKKAVTPVIDAYIESMQKQGINGKEVVDFTVKTLDALQK